MKDRDIRWEYVLSDNLRYGTKKQKVALLKWMNQKKFWYRKPTPEELVIECKKKSSSIYNLIEINQRRAAETYWRQTAQDIIRHIDVIKVDIKTSKVLTKPVRAWVPIRMADCGRILEEDYMATRRVHGNDAITLTVVQKARGDLLAWLERYSKYKEVLDHKNMNKIVALIKKLLNDDGQSKAG